MSTAESISRKSTLLATLPEDSRHLLLAHLEPITCELRRVLVESGQPMHSVYFPTSGWASMIRRLSDGRSAEVGLVGREGMVGLSVLLGNDISYEDVVIQAPGVMLRMPADALRDVVEKDSALRQHFLRYALAFQQMTSQTAACNSNHALEQRLARWLLMAHDRADGDEFPMTQEFLAMMLAVHRPGVNITARLFQQAGLIRYGNGHISVTDRPGLEASGCECYAAVREQFDRLLSSAKALA
jgi:CRP-like cAMP-binding protein